MKNYQQSGNVLEFTAAADIVSGQVVRVGNLLGVATGDVLTGEVGTIGFGVYTVPKVTGAVIANGDSLTWDASAAAFDDNAAVPAAGDVTGAATAAFEAAGAGVTSIAVLFTGVPGTLTA